MSKEKEEEKKSPEPVREPNDKKTPPEKDPDKDRPPMKAPPDPETKVPGPIKLEPGL